jgi:hypothetical protein
MLVAATSGGWQQITFYLFSINGIAGCLTAYKRLSVDG